MTDPHLSAISKASADLKKTVDENGKTISSWNVTPNKRMNTTGTNDAHWAPPEQIEQDIADGKRCSEHRAFIPCYQCNDKELIRRSAVMLRKVEQRSWHCRVCDGVVGKHKPDCELNQLLSDLGD